MKPLSVASLHDVASDEAEEISQELSYLFREAHASCWGDESYRGADRVEVRPVVTVDVRASADGLGQIQLVDLEVLPDVLPERVERCLARHFADVQYVADSGPYEHTLKHFARWVYGPAAKLLDDSPGAARARSAAHAQRPPAGLQATP